MNNREKGKSKEELAEHYLQSLGYVPLCRNFLRKTGEIDLIMKDGEYYVFVEVKYRKTRRNGVPAEAVTEAKKRRIYRTAEWFFMERHIRTKKARFDVVSILNDDIWHIRNAFGGL